MKEVVGLRNIVKGHPKDWLLGRVKGALLLCLAKDEQAGKKHGSSANHKLQTNEQMDNKQANKQMDNQQANKQANKQMDNQQANKQMDNKQANKQMDSKQANKQMDSKQDGDVQFAHLKQDVREETPEQATDHAKVGAGNWPVDDGQGHLQIVLSRCKLSLQSKEIMKPN